MDREELERLLSLARLRVTPEQEAQAKERAERVLAWFSMLSDVNTDDVEPSPYPLPIPLRLRPDEPGESLSQDEVLRNAPARRADAFLVPRVFDA